MNVEINMNVKLSEHFKLAEMTKTSVKTMDGNIPSHVHIENLKRVCRWLERLRLRCNQMRNEKLGMSNVNEKMKNEPHPEVPIIINSAYRSAAVNKAMGGAATSNHLTGCAADIRCEGIEQAIRYAFILLDISDESQEVFDELLIEQSAKSIWVHFAVKPEGNRRKIEFLKK
jgi:uncharacterized protein YcbK (DUF882 family)